MKDYYKLNILEIQELFSEEKLTCLELTNYYLKRIEQYNHLTNSISQLNPDAVSIAMKLDQELKSGKSRGNLHGIPVLIKDNINTNDKMNTTAGSIVLKDFQASYDAFIVKNLRKQGAVILGKTNLSEFANFVSSTSKNGFSALGGQVINPYNKNLDVGGSSSGSAAAIATSLAQVAVGTETLGSILSPCLRNSLLGVKPTVGWVSRTGIIPISHSQDVAGPIARNVIDASILLNGMTGFDVNDVTTHNEKSNEKISLDSILNTKSLKGTKVGVIQGYLRGQVTDEVEKIVQSTISKIKELGSDICDVETKKPNYDTSIDVMFYEFPRDLEDYFLKDENCPVKSLKEIIDFNNKDQENRVPYGQDILQKCIDLNLSENKYLDTRKKDLELAKSLTDCLDDSNLDALLYIGYTGTARGTKAGLPSVIIPCGYLADKSPVSITLMSKKFDEEKLLAIAYALEQSLNVRKEPNF
ncbi:amidase family protein [Mycoplasmatota bacterium WC44]